MTRIMCCKKNSTTHDVLVAIQTQAMLSDPKRMRFGADKFYMRSEEEMLALFPDHPEAIRNVSEVFSAAMSN